LVCDHAKIAGNRNIKLINNVFTIKQQDQQYRYEITKTEYAIVLSISCMANKDRITDGREIGLTNHLKNNSIFILLLNINN